MFSCAGLYVGRILQSTGRAGQKYSNVRSPILFMIPNNFSSADLLKQLTFHSANPPDHLAFVTSVGPCCEQDCSEENKWLVWSQQLPTGDVGI